MAENNDEEEHFSIVAGINSKLRRLERQRTAVFDAAAQKCEPLEAELAAIKDDLKTDLERMDTEKDRLCAELEEEDRIYHESSSEGDQLKKEAHIYLEGSSKGEDIDALGMIGESSTPVNDYENLSDGSFLPSEGELTGPNTPKLPTPLSQPRSQDKSKPKGLQLLPIGSLKPHATISGSHPTVVRSANNDCWVELRCFLCKVNATSTSGRFFRGVHGFMGHVKNMHLKSLPVDAEHWEFTKTAQACIFKTLSDDEAQGILDGHADAYYVPVVRMNTHENRIWKQNNEPTSEPADKPSSLVEKTGQAPQDIAQSLEESSGDSVQMHSPHSRPRSVSWKAARKSAPTGGTPRKRSADLMEGGGSDA